MLGFQKTSLVLPDVLTSRHSYVTFSFSRWKLLNPPHPRFFFLALFTKSSFFFWSAGSQPFCWLDAVDDFPLLLVCFNVTVRWKSVKLSAGALWMTDAGTEMHQSLVLKSHFFLHSGAFSRPPLRAPRRLSLAQSDGTTQWMSNDLRWGLLNMDSTLTVVMKLILWTGTDEHMWKCALLSTVSLFFFCSVLHRHSACLQTDVS